MGDGDIYTYNALPQNFKEDITIHKVGHHGAKSVLNDEMIKCPNLFIISTGLNVYNHPNNETLELLNKNGKRYLRTDYNNAIKLKFINDKRNMYMYSAKDRRFLSIK